MKNNDNGASAIAEGEEPFTQEEHAVARIFYARRMCPLPEGLRVAREILATFCSVPAGVWKPIGTAPFDREILVKDDKWSAVITISGPPDYDRPTYRFSHFAVCQEYDWEPKEWCEIPPAPQDESAVPAGEASNG